MKASSGHDLGAPPGPLAKGAPLTACCLGAAYPYDPVGNRTRRSRSLTSLGDTYDAVGNRLTRPSSLGSLASQSFSYDLNDRVDNNTNPADGTTYFDANGSTTALGGGWQYDWANRLTNFSTGPVSLFYDADGNRVKKIVGSNTNLFLVATVNPTGYAQVMEELSVSGGATNLARTYSYGLDLINQRQISGWVVSYYGYDGLGSVRFLTGTNGAIANRYAYEAFGGLISSNATIANVYLYTGEQFDPDLNLYFQRARYLHTSYGRFWTWTMDSYEGTQGDPLSLHKYLYAGDDPVNGVDPSGYDSLKAKLGEQVHKRLGEIFTGNGTIPLRFSGPSVATIGGKLKLPIPQKIQVLFPDLLDASRKEVYEIKPMTSYGLATGFFQALGYVSLLNQIDPSGGWHLGNTWSPPHFLILASGVAYVSPPVGGVIFYEAMTIQDIARRGARVVRTSDEGRLQQMTGISTLMSLMGGF